MRPQAVVAAVLAGLLCAGCVFLEVRRQQERAAQACRLSGTVSAADPEAGPLVVLLIRPPATAGGESEVIDHYTLGRAGRFYFSVTQPGSYALAAFHDLNSDLSYDPDEPAQVSGPATRIELAPGESSEGIEIVIEPDARAPVDGPLDVLALQARSVRDQLGTTIGQVSVAGDVVDLSDDRFGPESGRRGLWQPLDFALDGNFGIYFLEPYDLRRIPVLFVHGIGGYPQEFAHLIEHLDRRRFQPWFYFYPSGGALARVAEVLNQLVIQLRTEHRFRRLFLVAHSMGGLVSRGFLLLHHDSGGEDTVPLFVSISTPWAGHAAAQEGIDHAPAVVYSWIDIAPGSEYLHRLFFRDSAARQRRLLPDHVSFHLLFGFQRHGARLGPSGDKVVTLASELRPEAQHEAETIFGFDADHTGILHDPQTAERLNAILADAVN